MNVNFTWYFTGQIGIPESSAYSERLIYDTLSTVFSFLSLVEINFKGGSLGTMIIQNEPLYYNITLLDDTLSLLILIQQ